MARIMSLGTLASSMAHEVNQPLSGIVTNASTCLRLLAADPPEEIPVVFITAQKDDGLRSRVLEQGVCSSHSATRRCSRRSMPHFE